VDAVSLQLARQGGSVATRAVSAIESVLGGSGCDSYVKTIYIGYQLNGEMVAAVYPGKTTQVALALPEDFEGPDLIDATHLTWPTMPLAFLVTSDDHIPRAVGLVEQALDRVRAGLHDVVRPPEFFSNRGTSGGPPRPAT
jgi:hypothetical protein